MEYSLPGSRIVNMYEQEKRNLRGHHHQSYVDKFNASLDGYGNFYLDSFWMGIIIHRALLICEWLEIARLLLRRL